MKKIVLCLALSAALASAAPWRIKTPSAGGVDGAVQINKGGRLSGVDDFFAAAMNALLMSQTNVFAEMFDSTWSDSGGGIWINETGWTAYGATLTAPGQVTISADGAYVQSPKTTNGFASVELDVNTFGGASYSIEKSTNGTDWAAGSAGGENVFLRFSFESGPPLFGQSAYIEIYGAAVNGFEHPERFGAVNSFIGRDVRVAYAMQADNPVPLLQFQNDLSAAHGSRWAEWPADSDVQLNGKRLRYDENFYTTGTGTNGSLQIGWNRQPILEVFGGYTELVTPILSVQAASQNSLTVSTLGSSGWRPLPYYSTNLLTGAWYPVAETNFSSTYPLLVDGKYSLTVSNMNFSKAFFKVLATNETGLIAGGTNSIVSRFQFEQQGTLVYSGIPKSTNGLPLYAVWCDTNAQNTLKVILP